MNWKLEADKAARRHGIPPTLFRRLISQESGWQAHVRSPAGAIGFAQLMPGTAAGLGVDPNDPRQNLEGGARYLAQQYRSFGSWKLALAAYNAGPGRVTDGSWKNISETSNYVRSIMSGFKPGPKPAPQRTRVTPAQTLQQTITEGPLELDLSEFIMEELGQPSGLRKPRYALERLTGTVLDFERQAAAAAPPAANEGSPGPVSPRAPRQPARGPRVQPNYSSLKLGQVIGTPYAGTHSLGNWQSDNAYDISMPEGTPIRADFAGVVGSNIGPLGASGSRFAGSRVQIDGKGNSAWYGHLSRYVVKPGQRVKKGQIIGYSGSANGVPHLHVGFRRLPR